jgi:nucleotide-binding universal stress UspA family protein
MEDIVIAFRNILCPIDLSEQSIGPLVHAVALARCHNARLTVLHVVPTFVAMQVPSGVLGKPVRLVYPMPREEVLGEMRRVARLAGVPADAVLATESGDPSSKIVDHALAIRADLLVMGTHGHRGFRRLLLGSVAETVLHEAPCAVLTVPPHAVPSTSASVSFRQILCPVDFSPSALLALGFSIDLARQAKGSVTVLHVLEWLAEEEPRPSTHFNVPEYRRYLVDDAHERVQRLLTDVSTKCSKIEGVVVIGRPHREILRTAAARRTDLIVMGAQGRAGVELALFGSTTQQVVRHAPCPVLTVRGQVDP